MPEQEAGRMRALQLWVYPPAKDKMSDRRYREFDAAKIPSVQPAAGVTVKAIAAEVDDGRGGSVRGPIAQPPTDPPHPDVAPAPAAVWAYAPPAAPTPPASASARPAPPHPPPAPPPPPPTPHPRPPPHPPPP